MTRLICLAFFASASAAFAQPTEAVSSRPIEVAPIVSVGWRLLYQPAVQSDIGLSAEQKKALERVEARQSIRYEALYWGTLGTFTPEMTNEYKAIARDQFWTKTLTKAQRQRLRQIEYQLKEREFGAHVALALAAGDLGLRPDQLEDVTSIKGQRVEEIAKLVTSGERFEKVKTKVQATIGDTYDKIAEMLTRVQRERLKALKGKAFTAKSEPQIVMAPRPRHSYPKAFFGIYDFEIRYFGMRYVRDKLDLSYEQRRTIRDALDDWDTQYGNLPGKNLERVAVLHDHTAKTLDRLLTKEQRARFDRYMVRRRVLIGGLEAACGYPPVVAEIKITPIQLRELGDGESVNKVLTVVQLSGLQKFIGNEGDLTDATIDPVLARAEQLGAALSNASTSRQLQALLGFARYFLAISDRLKLSANQIKKLRDLAEDEPKFFDLIQRELSLADTPPVIGAGRSQTALVAVTEQYRAAVEEQCWNVLDDKQQSIAKQIYGRRK